MEVLSFLLEREVIITTAIVGAAITVVGTVMTGRKADFPPRLARGIMRFGYAVTFASIALFIVAGFGSGR
jgi:hypothetical protein